MKLQDSRASASYQDLSSLTVPSSSLVASKRGSILDTFVGHFSPGLDQLEEYYKSLEAEKALGPLATKLAGIVSEMAKPDVSTEHTGLLGGIKAAIAARDKDALVHAVDRFGNAATNGEYGDPATAALEARCLRTCRELNEELRQSAQLPWEELSSAVS